jgi:hypothetical protein
MVKSLPKILVEVDSEFMQAVVLTNEYIIRAPRRACSLISMPGHGTHVSVSLSMPHDA